MEHLCTTCRLKPIAYHNWSRQGRIETGDQCLKATSSSRGGLPCPRGNEQKKGRPLRLRHNFLRALNFFSQRLVQVYKFFTFLTKLGGAMGLDHPLRWEVVMPSRLSKEHLCATYCLKTFANHSWSQILTQGRCRQRFIRDWGSMPEGHILFKASPPLPVWCQGNEQKKGRPLRLGYNFSRALNFCSAPLARSSNWYTSSFSHS